MRRRKVLLTRHQFELEDVRDVVLPAPLMAAVDTALCVGKPLLISGEAGSGVSLVPRKIASELGIESLLGVDLRSSITVEDLYYTDDPTSREPPGQLQEDTGHHERPRFGALGLAVLMSQSPEEVRGVLEPELAQGHITASILTGVYPVPHAIPLPRRASSWDLAQVSCFARNCGIERDTRAVASGSLPQPRAGHCNVFISHASEDKDHIARPLAQALVACGLRVWYDEARLGVGDSLRGGIDAGLRGSNYAVVIVSKAFLHKPWPQKELDAIMGLEVAGRLRILAVWDDVTPEEVLRVSPLLAAGVAISSSKGLNAIVTALLAAMDQER